MPTTRERAQSERFLKPVRNRACFQKSSVNKSEGAQSEAYELCPLGIDSLIEVAVEAMNYVLVGCLRIVYSKYPYGLGSLGVVNDQHAAMSIGA